MSSLAVSTDLQEKRTKLLRSSSFQRFKCTAATHFQLAGSSFSKTSLAQLFEWVITKSRGTFQHTILFLSLPILKCLCSCTLWMIDLLTMLIGFNLIVEKTASKLYEKSRRFLSKIEQIHFKKLQKIANTSDALEKPKNEDTPIINANKNEENDVKQGSIKEYPVQTSRLENESSPVISPSLVLSAKEQLLKKPVKKPNKQSGLLIFCVYGSTSIVYIQLLLLFVGLQSAYAPPGLVFLVISLGYIGYIIYKVLCGNKVVPAKTKTKTHQQSTGQRFRLDRIATRKFLEFHNKTLSKIQLL